MEKFAVDLDKVLDDFELNEDRAERFAAKNKTQPKAQQPLLGRVSGRVGSKRECYPRPELSERLRRINLVDADFAPDPHTTPAPRVPHSIHDGSSDLQGSKNVNMSLQASQPQPPQYWHQNELPKSLSGVVVHPADEIVSETLSEKSSSVTFILNSASSLSDKNKEENVHTADENFVPNDGTHITGVGSSFTASSTCTDKVGVNLQERDTGEEETAASNFILSAAGNVEDGEDEHKIDSVLADEHSSELHTVSTYAPSEETKEVVEDSLSSINDRNSRELSKQISHDRPLDASLESGDPKNVPLDSLERRNVAVTSEGITQAENHDRLDSGETILSSVVDIPRGENTKPVSFKLEEDLSDSEVNRYLEELEEEEGGNEEETISTEKETVESITDVQKVVGMIGELGEASAVSKTEIEEIEDRERVVLEWKNLASENDKEEVDKNKIFMGTEVTERQTIQEDSIPKEQCINSEYKLEEDGKSDPECTQDNVPSLGFPCHSNLTERIVGEGADGEKERHVEGLGMEEENGAEKLSAGDSRKSVIDCRVESWVVEGNGKLLEGASINERTTIVSVDSASVSLKKQENKGVVPARPDSLSIVGVVASTGISSVDEEDPIPLPFIIGPPGATPANPRPPSEIASEITVNELSADQETGRPLEVESAEIPALAGVQDQASFQIGATEIEPVVLSDSVGAVSSVAVDERSGQSPASLTEASVSSHHDDVGDVKQPVDVGGISESGEDSSPDSGDRSSITGEIPSGVGLETQNVTGESAADSGLDFQLPSSAGSGVVSEETGCSALALGDVAPFWVPDGDAPSCMSCAAKFNLIKRRHHCRACGKVLCSKCCCSKARLAYMANSEARVCMPCHTILQEVAAASGGHSPTSAGRYNPNRGMGDSEGASSEHSPQRRHGFGRPDPNNPMEYCSTVPPLEQVGERARAPPPTVMVPVGVLKREGSSRSKGEAKQVMFSDGIRPGGELSDLDQSPNALSGSAKCQGLSTVQRKIASRLGKRLPGVVPPGPGICGPISQLPTVASHIPDDALPPMVDKSTGSCVGGGEYNFEEGPDLDRLMETLRDESEPPVAFALSKNFFVLVKIITLDCCVNRVVWSFTTRGMRCVGQDEVIVLLEWLTSDKGPPRDIFCHLGALYEQAAKGNTVTELGHSTVQGMFLGSHNHGGFLYIRATFQCLRRLPLPPPPFLFGLLLHRMETPWAKVFPIRVMLRLGAEFRYYPCPLVGIRGREPVYQQIGHTIMNLLSDFRNFAYVLPSVRGMVIHMEERQTSILLPKNRLSQVERALDDSDDHVLALAASFSSTADSHLVCVQGESGDASTGSNHYHTQAINIQNKPRKVTGASFVVFNGALKASAKLTAKSSIVEDGLMVQVLPDTLTTLRNALRNAEDFVIPCGPVSPATPSVQQSKDDDNENSSAAHSQPIPDEVVIIRWVEDDKNFNIGVKSPIDGMALDGVPSIRVHNGTNYVSDTKFIRWTEVFLIQCNEAPGGRGDTMDISRISESIAHAACLALHPYLDLLWSHALTLIAVRATLGPDSEGYEAGCGGSKLPPIYMNGLDNELVGVLHRIEARPRDGNLVLELLFHLMEL